MKGSISNHIYKFVIVLLRHKLYEVPVVSKCKSET